MPAKAAAKTGDISASGLHNRSRNILNLNVHCVFLLSRLSSLLIFNIPFLVFVLLFAFVFAVCPYFLNAISFFLLDMLYTTLTFQSPNYTAAAPAVAAKGGKKAAAPVGGVTKAKAAKKAVLQGTKATGKSKIRTSIRFHKPKTLTLDRKPKYPKKSAAKANKLDNHTIIRFPLTSGEFCSLQCLFRANYLTSRSFIGFVLI